ncbi:MAG: nucleoside deaminase [Chitinophagaceae bacterium]|nr:nucleoside deaminase [Chitinophagaceae bacterium]
MTDHLYFLRKALEVAKRSMDKGNLPFGCIMTGPDDIILLEGENTVITDENMIAHCEINLIKKLSSRVEPHFLEDCTIYTSTEPCAMCAGAIFWSGIGTVVYALGKDAYHRIAGTCDPAHILSMPARDIFDRGGREMVVLGPLMEDEAAACYTKWLNAGR